MEGLSQLISTTRSYGSLCKVKLIDVNYLMNIFFVDDVLILLDGCIWDATCFKHILSLFCKVACMMHNFIKSTIMPICCSLNEERSALQKFQFTRMDIEDGLKYLDFKLKLNDNYIAEWTWFIIKFEGHINIWQHR